MMEWFQKTQAGLVRSSVSSRASCTRMGRSGGPGRGAPSLCTVALTTGVLRTGRFGSLQVGGESTRKTRVNRSLTPTCDHGGDMGRGPGGVTARELRAAAPLPGRAEAPSGSAQVLSLMGHTRGQR